MAVHSSERQVPVMGFPDYTISTQGILRRVILRRGKNNSTGKSRVGIIKGWKGKNGYRYFSLHAQTGKKYIAAHKLIATHFLPTPSYKADINHLDGNKLNNILANLEWCSRQENCLHASRLGLLRKGEARPEAKLTESQVLAIRRDYRPGYGGLATLARKYGVQASCIFKIITRHTWKHI